MRARLEVTRPLSDLDVFQVAMLSASNEADELLEFAFDRALARELRGQTAAAAMTRREWVAVFAGIAVPAVDVDLGATRERMEAGLEFTLKESDQRARWGRPAVRLLSYVALHAKEDVEEKIADVLGEVIRIDTRRLDDLRTQLEGEGADVVVLATAVREVARAVGLA